MCVCECANESEGDRDRERESKRRTNEMNYTMATDKAGGNCVEAISYSWILVW